MENKYVFFSGIIIASLLATTFAFASNGNRLVAQEEDITLFGIDIEALISIATTILASFLFSISFIAYRKDRRERLLFVTAAFFLFAVKGFLVALDEIVLLEEFPLELEAIAQLLDFGVLALFFLGLMRK
ncbi:hypothetical protein GTO27_12675 [Candidatus Bathyarchaeota archaeon]|nr:hypothetical protein [Candidatus Bathyarchaeota archaeon]